MKLPRWPQERKDLLRRLYAEEMPRDKILAELNKLDGPLVMMTRMKSQLGFLGAKRPPSYEVEDRVWTPKRKDILRAEWPGLKTQAVILAMINESEGPKVTKFAMGNHARKLKLSRPTDGRYDVGMINRWGSEREEILRRGVDDGLSRSNLAKLISKTEGPEVTVSSVEKKMMRMGLRYKRVSALKPVVKKPKIPAPKLPPVPPRLPPKPTTFAYVQPVVAEPYVEKVGPDGIILAPFWYIRRWCQDRGFDCDGSDMDRVNKVRKYLGLPPFAIDVPSVS